MTSPSMRTSDPHVVVGERRFPTQDDRPLLWEENVVPNDGHAKFILCGAQGDQNRRGASTVRSLTTPARLVGSGQSPAHVDSALRSPRTIQATASASFTASAPRFVSNA